MKFINNMEYMVGATSVTEADKKSLKCLSDILLLVKACSREVRRTILGKLPTF